MATGVSGEAIPWGEQRRPEDETSARPWTSPSMTMTGPTARRPTADPSLTGGPRGVSPKTRIGAPRGMTGRSLEGPAGSGQGRVMVSSQPGEAKDTDSLARSQDTGARRVAGVLSPSTTALLPSPTPLVSLADLSTAEQDEREQKVLCGRYFCDIRRLLCVSQTLGN